MVNFTALLDESGTHDASPVTVMAAYVSTNNRWTRFERDARPLLQSYGVETIHATRLWGSSHDFHKWTRQKKQALLRDLGRLMKRWVLFGFTVTLDDKAYTDIIKTHPAGTPDSEFAACFRVCMLYIPRLIIDRGIDRDPRLHFVIEDGHKNLQEAIHLFGVSQQADATLNRQLLSIAPADKRKFVATQLADLLAYLSYRHSPDFVTTKIMLPASDLLQELVRGAPVNQHFFNERELVSVKLSVVTEWARVSKLVRAAS